MEQLAKQGVNAVVLPPLNRLMLETLGKQGLIQKLVYSNQEFSGDSSSNYSDETAKTEDVIASLLRQFDVLLGLENKTLLDHSRLEIVNTTAVAEDSLKHKISRRNCLWTYKLWSYRAH